MKSFSSFPAAALASGVFALAPAAMPAWAADAGTRPNIVVILADDLGTDWLGCYGSDHPTPNLDRLAKEGTRYETAWTAPICTPSRVSLLTGLYGGHTGWTEHYDVPRWGGAGLIAGKFPTWPQILRQHGYATAIVGKWQINDLRDSPDVLQRHGFDAHCVWTGVEANNPASEKRYWDAFLQIDGQRGPCTGRYGPDVCQAYAFDFIRKNRERPFLLYYPMIAIHDPIEPTPLNRAHPPADPEHLLADAVTYLDHQVGELLDELQQEGVAGRTIVVFAGDNGSSLAGTVLGRRVQVGKAHTTDWGVHVPLLVKVPGIDGGRVTKDLADFTDIFPTLLDLAGISRAGYLLDGVSLLPGLRQDPHRVPRRWVYAQRDLARTVRNERYKLDSSGAFFDLQADPDERKPIDPASSPAAAAAWRELAAALAQIPADAATPPFPGYTPQKMRDYMSQNHPAEPAGVHHE